MEYFMVFFYATVVYLLSHSGIPFSISCVPACLNFCRTGFTVIDCDINVYHMWYNTYSDYYVPWLLFNFFVLLVYHHPFRRCIHSFFLFYCHYCNLSTFSWLLLENYCLLSLVEKACSLHIMIFIRHIMYSIFPFPLNGILHLLPLTQLLCQWNFIFTYFISKDEEVIIHTLSFG